MKTRSELENKALELEKRVWNLEHSGWTISKENKEKADLLRQSYFTVMWALGYKPKSIYFNCTKCEAL